MDIAAFIIAGFLVGFVVGTIYAVASTKPVMEAYRAESQRWHEQAMDNLELLLAEKAKRQHDLADDKSDQDWWKKE